MNFLSMSLVVTNKFIDAHRATLLVQDLFSPKIIGILTMQCAKDNFGLLYQIVRKI